MSTPTEGSAGSRWQDAAVDPNSAAARGHRRAQLEDRMRVETRSRIEVVRALCSGKRVLDIGCVAHDVERRGSSKWLHQHVADVAATVLGIDYDAEGIAELTALGYDCRVADVTQGPEQVADRGPFDVLVAGEVIEHLACPEALFNFAAAVLEPGGLLVITTPNPYAPWRVRAGQTGFVHENVDHVVLAFPSGIVEMAERTGLRLDWFATVGGPPSSLGPAIAGMRRMAYRKLGLERDDAAKGRSLDDGASDHGASRPGPDRHPAPWYFDYPSPWRVLTSGIRGTRGRTGETAIYVVVAP